jgi:hypothetical protein
MNSIVNFEIAKLLKKKSFPHDFFYKSWYNERGVKHGRTDINKDGKTFLEVYPNEDSFYGCAIKPEHKKEFTIEKFSAPTLSDVIMWLYEKHNIWIEVKRNIKFFSYIDECKYMNYYDNPTDAYSDAVLYALKELVSA